VKSRVAFIATLAVSILLVVLLVLSSVALIRERNEDLSTELETACYLIKEAAPSGDDSETFTALAQYLGKEKLTLVVCNKGGEGINPADIARAYQKKDIGALNKLRVDICMECGCCSYICPAHRPLVQTNKLSKALIREEKMKEEKK